MAKKNGLYTFVRPTRQSKSDPMRPKNKHKRANYKKYRGQGR